MPIHIISIVLGYADFFAAATGKFIEAWLEPFRIIVIIMHSNDDPLFLTLCFAVNSPLWYTRSTVSHTRLIFSGTIHAKCRKFFSNRYFLNFIDRFPYACATPMLQSMIVVFISRLLSCCSL